MVVLNTGTGLKYASLFPPINYIADDAERIDRKDRVPIACARPQFPITKKRIYFDMANMNSPPSA